MKKIFLLFLLLFILNAERSVYSDSDFIDTDLLIKKNKREIFLLKQKISQLREEIEGLKSLIQGQSAQIRRLKELSNNKGLEKIINNLSTRVAKLESRKPEVIVKNNIVEKKIEKQEVKIPKKEEKKPKVEVKKLSGSELFKKSVLDFKNKRFSKAQAGFKELLKRNYKNASSNFYLGEIAFHKKRYKEAIKYYQESAILNEDAAYMDKLLLHTAIALKKIGKIKEAKSFFKAIIDSYPGTISAKKAKKYLK